MSEPTAETRPSTPFPLETVVVSAPADPLDGDWSEGLRGPVRPLGIPAPRLLSAAGISPELEPAVAATAGGTVTAFQPAEAAQDEMVEAPDAWSVAGDDPLHSVPPPVAQHRAEADANGSTLANAVAAASAQHLEVSALAALLPEDGVVEPPGSLELQEAVVELPASDALAGSDFESAPPPEEAEPEGDTEGAAALRASEDAAHASGPAAHLPLDAHEGVVELPAAEALDAQDGELVEAERLPPFEESAPHAEADAWVQAITAHAPAETGGPFWNNVTPICQTAEGTRAPAAQASPVWSDATAAEAQPVWPGAVPAEAQPIWSDATAAEAQPVWSDATGPHLESPVAEQAPAPAAPSGSPAAPDWSAVSSGPDWSSPVGAPPATQDGWGAPPPVASESAWTQGAPIAPASDWQAAAVPAAQVAASPGVMDQLPADEPEPPMLESKAALFAPLAQGESLAAEDSVVIDSDPDLPVPFEEPFREPLAQIETVGGLSVAGEHRVAVHTRGGRTLRGSVRDIDLSKSQFRLQPQGGEGPEAVYHAEVKAIFFMLSPGEKPHAAYGNKVRITFADGRAIDGTRDGAEGKHGFFLVPADAARTNTRRIYVARDAITDLKDG